MLSKNNSRAFIDVFSLVLFSNKAKLVSSLFILYRFVHVVFDFGTSFILYLSVLIISEYGLLDKNQSGYCLIICLLVSLVSSDTLYFVYNSDSDKGSLYLGDRLISGDISNITDLKDLIITEL